ncbi:hypothetical protein Trydic_g79 [Trypoxylus dichotomus]
MHEDHTTSQTLYKQQASAAPIRVERLMNSRGSSRLGANRLLLESPPGGISCNFGTWRMLNGFRTSVAPVKVNVIRWDFA